VSADAVIVVAGRPRLGKTALGLAFAKYASQFCPGVIIPEKAQSAFQIPVKGMPIEGSEPALNMLWADAWQQQALNQPQPEGDDCKAALVA
jgi:hypothetical protein